MTEPCQFQNPELINPELTNTQLKDLLDFQRRMLEAVVVGNDHGELLDEVCRQAESFTSNSIASVMLFRADQDALFVESAPSAPSDAIEALNGLRAGEGSCGNVVFHNKAMYVENTFCDARWSNVVDVAQKYNICSCFAFPIFTGDRQSIGSFAISSFEHRAPEGFHRALLETCASLCGLILRRNADQRIRQELQANQVQAARLESLGIVAGGLAHDFNNLLTAIMGHVDLSLVSLPEGAARNNLESAIKATERAKDLTSQLLTVAKGGSPTRRPNDIISIVRDSAEFVLRGGNVRLEVVNSCEQDSPIVNVDGGQISQLVQNLVLNASQAMHEGGAIRIECDIVNDEAPPTLQDGSYFRMTFRDTGSGIPEALREHVFDPHFTTRKTGSGLGLFVCSSIAKSHGGSITVDSSSSNGTSFVVYLPYETGLREPELGKTRAGSVGRGGRVLIMDDEPSVRSVLSQMLTVLDFEVSETQEGAEAARLFADAYHEGRPFDVAILDLTIPDGLGGVETRDMIRRIDPAAKVVISSGYPTAQNHETATEQMFSAQLGKPYRIADLRRVLNDLMAVGPNQPHAASS
ncbi:MAG: ATP-binding protein [Aureliella sp.]